MYRDFYSCSSVIWPVLACTAVSVFISDSSFSIVLISLIVSETGKLSVSQNTSRHVWLAASIRNVDLQNWNEVIFTVKNIWCYFLCVATKRKLTEFLSDSNYKNILINQDKDTDTLIYHFFFVLRDILCCIKEGYWVHSGEQGPQSPGIWGDCKNINWPKTGLF